MFRFLELELHHWDLWRAVRIPLDGDVVLVSGPNGSGKTTLVDAIRQLLNAPRLSSSRRLQHYLRQPDAPALIRAVVSNRDATGTAPPFRRERIVTPEVTLACALVPSGGGTPEKRFAVLAGRPPLDELRRVLLDSRDFYAPERYARALEHAGVTRSLMSVLAIEQGRTNALFELTPRELFKRVLEMLGDHAILERYREARRRYEDSDQELGRQLVGLQGRQAELTRVHREVLRREEWEEGRDKVAGLEARLPAAELQRELRAQAEATAKSRELSTKVRRGEADRLELEARLRLAGADEARALVDLDGARGAEGNAQEAWAAATREEERAALRLADLEAAAREAAAITPGDLGGLEAEDTEAARSLFRAEEAARLATERATGSSEKVDRLTRGLPDYPEDVRRTLMALERRGLEAVILAATVDVADAEVAESLEAALGNARYALLVSPADHDLAVGVARAHAFPGPVYAGPRVGEGASDGGATGAENAGGRRVGALAMGPHAPAWLGSWLASIELDADAWRDPRGTWVGRVRERVLGAAGREAALAQARRDFDEADVALAAAREALAAAGARRKGAEEGLAAERRRQSLHEELRALPGAREQATSTARALREAKERLEGAAAAREAAHARHAAATQELLKTTSEAESLASRLAGERKALEEAVAEVTKCGEKIRGLRSRVTLDLEARAERGELDGPDTVLADLSRAHDAFARLGEPPPPEIREEERHLRANVEELERHVADRRREAEEARAELAECRRRYLEVVSGALGDYQRRAKEIARGADAAIEMELPRLADDDRVLDEAGVQVRIGFDGKEPLPLGDSSFSGGQQVIAGLILLMAMAETDGHGFFMLDEPFAHLSIDRIDDVGRFLRSTRSQFILTAPTTLDRAQLDPASLVIVLQKKKPDEAFAPVPIVAGA